MPAIYLKRFHSYGIGESHSDKKRETLRLRAPVVQLLPSGAYDAYVAAQVKLGREAARIKTPRVTMDTALVAQFPAGIRAEAE